MIGSMVKRSPLAREFWENGRAASCPIDMHGHMGSYHSIYFPRGEAPDMIRTMDGAGVRLLLFSHHPAALNSPDLGNRLGTSRLNRRFPNRLRAYCVISPNCRARCAGSGHFR